MTPEAGPAPLAAAAQCPPPDLLRRFFVGQISRRELEAVEGHISSCAVCASDLGALGVSDPLVEAVRAQPAAERRLAAYRGDVDKTTDRVRKAIKRSVS
ncbi:MAG: hypothetical protein ACREHD_06635 [Pirellulales bacterium]